MTLELTVKGDIERLHLEEGDVLVFKLPQLQTADQFREAEMTLQVLMERMGMKDRFLVLDGDRVELTKVSKALVP